MDSTRESNRSSCSRRDRSRRSKKAIHLTHFLGYETETAPAEVKGIIAQHQLCDRVNEVGHEQPITVVLDQTPFYGESGGQVGDTGEIVGQGFQFRVSDTQKDGDLVLHVGHLMSGEMRAGATVTARVDAAHRAAIRRAHSATHILHYALQKNLGRHAQQQGSKVDRDWLRFDFTNLSAVGDDQLLQVEHDVKERIQAAAAGAVGLRAVGRGPREGGHDVVRREVPGPGAPGHDGGVQPRTVRRNARVQYAGSG